MPRTASLAALVLLAPALLAQDKAAPAPTPSTPIIAVAASSFGYARAMLLQSAQKMPEVNFSFKPVETVRSFGQILGHVADANNEACSVVLGEKNPQPEIEKTKTAKSDLIAALQASFELCARAHASMNEATAVANVQVWGQSLPRLGILLANDSHTLEHYGNLITYMRIKGIVPPSSEQAPPPPPPPAEKK